MSDARSGSGWDFVWFIAMRAGALAIAIGSVAILVSDAEHETVSQEKAMAVHRATLVARMRKPKAMDGVSVPVGSLNSVR